MTLPIITAAIVTFLVLGAGGMLTTVGPWYRALPKPSWNPPDWIFGPAWTLILTAAATAGVLAWTTEGASHGRILALYAINIVFHMSWTPLFFNLRRPDWALIESVGLWASIVALMVGLAPYSTLAACLFLPYLLWVSFATFLTYSIVRMNPPFRTATRAEMKADFAATPLGPLLRRRRVP